jgi:hypothetical protein
LAPSRGCLRAHARLRHQEAERSAWSLPPRGNGHPPPATRALTPSNSGGATSCLREAFVRRSQAARWGATPPRATQALTPWRSRLHASPGTRPRRRPVPPSARKTPERRGSGPRRRTTPDNGARRDHAWVAGSRALQLRSSSRVVSVLAACHAGGRGFESRRSRSSARVRLSLAREPCRLARFSTISSSHALPRPATSVAATECCNARPDPR